MVADNDRQSHSWETCQIFGILGFFDTQNLKIISGTNFISKINTLWLYSEIR